MSIEKDIKKILKILEKCCDKEQKPAEQVETIVINQDLVSSTATTADPPANL